MKRLGKMILLVLATILGQASLSAQPSLESGSVIEAAERLKAGEFLWAPEIAPEGPLLLVVSLATQRAVIYRNGISIGITTVSTGRPGHRTPTGIFTVLERDVEHYSSLYNAAPMPYMQRITWGGVALHGGQLPGYPASHGCIRLPHEFARLLFGVTRLGMTVVITSEAAVPRVAPAESLLRGRAAPLVPGEAISWQPERSRSGPISIVISAADRRLLVLRNGIVIGRAPVTIDEPISRTSAYAMRATPAGGRGWLRIGLPGQAAASDAQSELRGRIHVPDEFRRSVEAILQPGATVVITGDTLQASGTGHALTVAEDENRR
jgi:hypothetical protein